MDAHVKKPSKLIIMLAIAACILIATLVKTTNVRLVMGDSALSMLVSQTIINEGTIKLDKYSKLIKHYGLRKEENGHYYDMYPMGTPLLSLPAVYIANSAGMNAFRMKDNSSLQVTLASIISPLIFLMLFLIGRRYVSDMASLCISLIMFLGSSLMSSLAVALWSHNYAILLSLIVFWLIARHETSGGQAKLHPYIIGVLLFLCYLTRPSFSIFILATFSYLFFADRKALIKAAGLSFVLLMGFVGFSLMEFGTFLPYYYTLKLGTSEPLTALYGVLFSPSRGLFIYSPMLLLIVAGIARYFRVLKGNRTFLMALGWAAFNIITVAIWAIWSGGHCFGPRLLVDSFPSYVIITFMLWSHLPNELSGKLKKAGVWSFMVLSAFAIWANSYQGIYNEWTHMWNKFPSLGKDVNRIVLDWSHMQIFSTAESVKDKLLWFYGDEPHEVVIDHQRKILLDFDLSGKSPDGFIKRGTYRVQQGNAKGALEDYNRALAGWPNSLKALQLRGSLLLTLGNLDPAIRDLDAVLAQNPRNFAATADRGLAYARKNLYEKALMDFNYAVALNPRDPQPLMMRGIMYFRTGQYSSAMKDLESISKINRHTYDSRLALATTYYVQGDFNKAARNYEQAVNLNPAKENAWLMLIMSASRVPGANVSSIVDNYRNYMDKNPSRQPIRMTAHYYLGLFNLTEADVVKEAEKQLSASGSAEALCQASYFLAEKRLQSGNSEGALNLIKQGVNFCPKAAIEHHTSSTLIRKLEGRQ